MFFISAVVANCPFKTHLGGNSILSLAKWGSYSFLVVVVSVGVGDLWNFGVFLNFFSETLNWSKKLKQS